MRTLRTAVVILALVGAPLGASLGCKPRSKGPAGWGFQPPQVPAAPQPIAAQPTPGIGLPATPEGYQGLGVESIPPEVLARHAAPALKPEQSRRIQAMLDLRAPQAGRVTPDGKKLFFGWSITGTPQLFRLDGPMSFPTQMTGGEDPTQLAGITPDGKWLVIARDRNGEENPGLYLLSPDGGALVAIQHKAKVQTQLNWISDDGSYLYYRANDVAPDSYAIYKYDIAAKKAELVFGEAGIWSVADVEKDKLLLVKEVGSNMAEFYEYTPATKKLEHVIGKGEREDYVAAYGAGGEIIVLTPKIGEYRRLYHYKEGKLEPISPDIKFDVSSFDVDRAKKRILYSVNEGGYTRLRGMNAATKKDIKLPTFPQADHVFIGATSDDGRFTAFVVDSGTAPAQSYMYDWRTDKLTRWHKPSSPEIDTSTFARVSLESYPARDGTSIPLFVRRPAGCASASKPCPVVVSFHGGPEAQTLAGFSTRAQMFVDAGFIYAEPNVRGSDGYGKTWIHADDGDKRLAVITDIEDASKFVRDKWSVGGVKPKVGIYGGSYGGYSVLVGMSMFAGAYDVGVSVVGISSLVTFLENTAPYRRILRISEYGDPEKQRATLEQLSPITHVDKVAAPLMLLQGATDPRVPVGEALQFHEALKKKSIPTELIIFPDEGHGFQKRPNQVLAMGHTIRFFQEHLK
jgi:dipeptidyl aminopeptidase/acylaminoacyl peptidase